MTLAPKAAFDVLTAAEWNELIASQLSVPTVANVDDTSRTLTSTTFTSTLSPANICGIAFTAPASGKVLITLNVDQRCSAGFIASSLVIKQGSTVGSGTSVLAAGFNLARMDYNSQQTRAAVTFLQTGLTPGAAFNAYIEHLVSAGTGTVVWRSVTVVPQVL